MAITKEEQDIADAKAAADKVVADAKAAAVKAAADEKAALAKIKYVVLTAPYGFYEDDGTYVGWSAGQNVTDASEIAELIERKAPVEITSNE